MAASFFVNAMQFEFAYVLAMENSGMVCMFKTLEDTWLKGFLEVSNSVYEGAMLEFFANAKVIAGTVISFIANRKLAITKDVFAKVFGLPSEGLVGFLDIPTKTMVEMRRKFSGSEVSFKAPNKNKEMKMEYRLLHDIVCQSWLAAVEKPKKKKDKVVRMEKKRKVAVQQPVEARAKLLQRSPRLRPAQTWIHACAYHKEAPIQEDKEGDPQTESQPGPIPEIPAGGDKGSTAGGPEATMEMTPELSVRRLPTQHQISERIGNQSIRIPNPQQKGTLKRLVGLLRMWRIQRWSIRLQRGEFGSVDGQQVLEQPAPEEEDQPEKSPTHSDSSYGSSAAFSVNNEDSVDSLGPYPSSSADPSLSLSPSLNLGPNPSNLQMVVYTENREENNRPAHKDDEGSSQAGPQQVFMPILSSRSRKSHSFTGFEGVYHGFKGTIHAKVISLDSKVEELLNIQTFMKHEFSVYKRAFYEKMVMVSANVASSQTSLETSLVRQFTEHQL
ncbi:hypothetical protein F511_24551 [Dorcoceras hygrometricum]|uniref:Uncharacterized protein n=1 Tax=Dorcoceras hygrometricum TaxID=472368 RepID=A0A2Z7BXB6_9LAMI|nr:hypothetical protein F511_24551 [Dorcoceras hygrometricum]